LGRVDFALVAVDPAAAAALVAAELDARVAGHVQLDLRLEDEVGVTLLGAEEGVRPRADLADDAAVLDLVGRAAAGLAPALEALAVEQRHKGLLLRARRRRAGAQQSRTDHCPSDALHRGPLFRASAGPVLRGQAQKSQTFLPLQKRKITSRRFTPAGFLLPDFPTPADFSGTLPTASAKPVGARNRIISHCMSGPCDKRK